MPQSFEHVPASISSVQALSPILDLCRAGQIDEAKSACEEQIERIPDTLAARHLLAMIEYEGGQRDEAMERLNALLNESYDDASLHNTLGNILLDMKMVPEAEAAYRQAMDIAPDDFETLLNLGNLLRFVGDLNGAEDHYRSAVEHHPESARGHLSLGNLLLAANRAQDALDMLERAVELTPDHSGAHNNLGVALMMCGRHEQAEAALRTALSIHPDDATLLIPLGKVLQRSGRLEEARETFFQALTHDPSNSNAHRSLADLMLEEGRSEEAEMHLRDAVDRAPQNGGLRLHLGIVQLGRGNFDEGWLNFEARPHEIPLQRRIQSCPLWSSEPLDRSKLLVTAEGSAGDMFQFLRHLHGFRVLGRDVTLEVPDPLVPLMETNTFGVPIIGQGRNLRDFDFVTRLMSLPLLAGQKHPFSPSTGAYLAADPERIEIWHEQLGERRGKRVAIAIAGLTDEGIDIPVSELKPLLELPELDLISLATGKTEEEMRSLDRSNRMRHIGDTVRSDASFQDAAAVLADVDLVIACDGDLAHLAGALGKPTWLLLGRRVNWRWGETSDTTEWYPQMRIFRSTQSGGWDRVMTRVVEHLL